MLELRDPPPTWEAFRHIPQIGCPRCDARHPGGPVFRIFPHHRYGCTRHGYWIGPPDINHPGPYLEIFPDIVAAQRRHLRLVHRHGWAAAYDAVLTALMICAHLWEQDPDNPYSTSVLALNQVVWNVRSFVFIPKNAERETFSASRLFAAIYPEAISIAVLIGSPAWRRLAAGDDEQLSRFTAVIGWRLGDPLYQPRGERDPIAHWIEQDCWRPPSPPPTTFAAAPGHRRPSHLDTTVTRANRERHDKAALWFSRKRRPGQAILHHRTVHPVVIREWSIQMERFDGAIWQSHAPHRFQPAAAPGRIGQA
ncbi:hypothetical protein ACQEVF_53070 [Nonomuraea polychroma]|uniref:hypothetical protein n=1 Tax=Nonomuraea polychroma TaxID=46176 RepID=UPI003D929F61